MDEIVITEIRTKSYKSYSFQNILTIFFQRNYPRSFYFHDDRASAFGRVFSRRGGENERAEMS